jgi:hypothetical protein
MGAQLGALALGPCIRSGSFWSVSLSTIAVELQVSRLSSPAAHPFPLPSSAQSSPLAQPLFEIQCPKMA